jgi:hypothetical protein
MEPLLLGIAKVEKTLKFQKEPICDTGPKGGHVPEQGENCTKN